MLLGKILIYVLEAAFLLGILGSAVVIGITFVEDFHEFSKDE